MALGTYSLESSFLKMYVFSSKRSLQHLKLTESLQIATVQTISGTGANHLGALFLKKFLPETSGKVYIGTPTWGNYLPLFNHAGFATVIYEHYDTITRQLNFPSILSVVRKAPATSIFVFQGCCHNPTAMNMSKDQWRQLASEMKAANHFPFIGTSQSILHGYSILT